MARTKAGLTEPEIAALREQLAAGRRPRVQLSGPHFPVEATGTVVWIGSPETDGPDYLRVRVKVNGMTDELAFAPSELNLRRQTRRTAKTAGRPAQPAPVPTSKAPRQPAKASAPTVKAPRQPAKAASQPAEASQPAKTAAQPAEATQPAPAAGRPAKAAPPTAATPDQPTPVRPAAARRRRPASTPVVSFTVSSSGASWALSASRGTKAVVRNLALPPGLVGALAELIGQPTLTDAVSEINDAALAEARTRAEQLRAELDQLEAVLATHRRP